MQPSDTMHDVPAHDRAQRKIDQAMALLREAREELRSWAPPAAINDLEAAESVLQGLPAKLPRRE